MGTEDLVQWDKVAGLKKSKLDILLDSRKTLKAEMEAAKEKLDGINNKILAALVTVGVKSVAVGETRVTFLAGGPTETLDKKVLYTRLLELGVAPKLVDKAYRDATTVKEDGRAPSIRVTEPKEEER